MNKVIGLRMSDPQQKSVPDNTRAVDSRAAPQIARLRR
jgi:hypothetical protein